MSFFSFFIPIYFLPHSSESHTGKTDVTVALVIFIGDIYTLHKGLYQRYKHIGCGVFGIFPPPPSIR